MRLRKWRNIFSKIHNTQTAFTLDKWWKVGLFILFPCQQQLDTEILAHPNLRDRSGWDAELRPRKYNKNFILKESGNDWSLKDSSRDTACWKKRRKLNSIKPRSTFPDGRRIPKSGDEADGLRPDASWRACGWETEAGCAFRSLSSEMFSKWNC